MSLSRRLLPSTAPRRPPTSSPILTKPLTSNSPARSSSRKTLKTCQVPSQSAARQSQSIPTLLPPTKTTVLTSLLLRVTLSILAAVFPPSAAIRRLPPSTLQPKSSPVLVSPRQVTSSPTATEPLPSMTPSTPSRSLAQLLSPPTPQPSPATSRSPKIRRPVPRLSRLAKTRWQIPSPKVPGSVLTRPVKRITLLRSTKASTAATTLQTSPSLPRAMPMRTVTPLIPTCSAALRTAASSNRQPLLPSLLTAPRQRRLASRAISESIRLSLPPPKPSQVNSRPRARLLRLTPPSSRKAQTTTTSSSRSPTAAIP